MRIHTQNLNEHRDRPAGSMFWRGRAWLHWGKSRSGERLGAEWYFGKYARDFAVTATFGHGDSDAGICLHLCVPWLFSVYLTVPNVYRCRESVTGIAIHNGGLWIYPVADQIEWRNSDPWWRKCHYFEFPWTYRHHLTEILEHRANLPSLAKTVWSDKGKKFLESWDERKAAEQSVSETYDYAYTLKNGETQMRRATVHVERMTWRMRRWPLLPFKKVSTSISVQFNEEVGEGTGSWKGGCIGCGYNMLPGETPLECLRRMEQERTFTR